MIAVGSRVKIARLTGVTGPELRRYLGQVGTVVGVGGHEEPLNPWVTVEVQDLAHPLHQLRWHLRVSEVEPC